MVIEAKASLDPDGPKSVNSDFFASQLQWPLALLRRAIRARQHDDIAVRIAQPAFPVVGAIVALGRVAVARHDDLGLHLGRAQHGRVEIIGLEPEQDAVAIRLVIGIANRPVMVFDVEAVQLQDQHAMRGQSLIFMAAMRAIAAKQALIPPAAGLDIGNGNEGLGAHLFSLSVR
jgi:hypothetical protein